MKQLKSTYLTAILVAFALSGYAQEILEKADAVAIALENNFDIRAAKNNLDIARNNARITNSGYLPSVSGNAGANYTVTDSDLTFQNGNDTTLSDIPTSRLNAAINLDYTLFDGLGRMYNYAKLKETYRLTDLQARGVMENTLINIFTSYYEIARLSQNLLNQSRTLDISRERLLRAQYSFEYGQNTQLDVLNAEVDYNTDSISYLNISQLLDNEKHNLNMLLGREVSTPFAVDTTLSFSRQLDLNELLDNARLQNANLMQQVASLRNAEYDIRINTATILPRVGINAGYSKQNNDLGPGGFLSQQQSTGLSVSATLTWNLWDGGISNTRRQNSIISRRNQEIALEQAQLNLERNVSNAWTTYRTALFTMNAQRTNLQTNQRNFDRTEEQFSLGQITSIEFRQAQFNLLNAQLNYSQARYSAKIAELALLQLSGEILSAEF